MTSETAKRSSSQAEAAMNQRLQAAQSKYDALQQSYAQLLGRLEGFEQAEASRSKSGPSSADSRA